MIGWLLGVPSSLKVALVGALACGALYTWHTIEVNRLRADLTDARAAIVETEQLLGTSRAQLVEMTANRDALAATVERQNARIEQLRVDGETRAAQAALAAQQRAAPVRPVVTPRPEPIGPERMNTWLESALLSP